MLAKGLISLAAVAQDGTRVRASRAPIVPKGGVAAEVPGAGGIAT